jgi:hypothetical protein
MEYEAVGKSIRVLIEGQWMEGFVDEYHPDRGYHIQYFDGDSDWLMRLDRSHVQLEGEDGNEQEEDQEAKDLEELDDINFFDNEEEDELNIIPSKLSSRKNSNRSQVPDFNATEDSLLIIPDSNNSQGERGSVPALDIPNRSKQSSRPASAKSRASTDLRADEKPSSRKNSQQSLLSAKQQLMLDEENHNNNDLTLEDELLMQDDFDESIMYKEVEGGEGVGNEEQPHVIVQPVIVETPSSRRSSRNNEDDDVGFRPTNDEENEEQLGEEEEDLDDEGMPIIHNLDYYQEKSREIIIAQSILLQNNSLLMVGSVLSAQFYDDNTASNATGTMNNNRQQSKDAFDGGDFKASRSNLSLPKQELFFRVLFIEGGSQPIMFRCKTPIFTSNNTFTRTAQPIWRENIFRCDMLMPITGIADTDNNRRAKSASSLGSGGGGAGAGGMKGRKKSSNLSTIAEAKGRGGQRGAGNEEEDDEQQQENDGHHTAPFPVTGEIVISVYRVRPNGGNDLMGQIILDMKRMSQNGTYEYYNELCEGRCYSGKYPLTLNQVTVGEMELHLGIAWKLAEQEYRTMPSRGNLSSAGLPRPKSASGSAVGKNLSADVPLLPILPKTATNATGLLPPKQPKKSTTAAEPKKQNFISAQAKKQRDDAKRIEKENAKLQKRIQAFSGQTSGSAYNKPDKTTTTTTAAQPRPSLLVNNFLTTAGQPDERSLNRKQNQQNAADAVDETRLYEKYLLLFNNMKKKIATDETEILSLKAKLNNYNIQIKKYQASIEKIKSFGGGGGGGSVASSMTGGTRTSVSRGGGGGGGSRSVRAEEKSVRRSQEPSPMAFRSAVGKSLQQSSLQAKEEQGEEEEANSPDYEKEQHDQFDKREQEEEQAAAKDSSSEIITDPEYLSIKEEFDVLQNIRKSLIQRIIKAKEIFHTYYHHQDLQQSQQDKILERIHSLSAHHQDEDLEATAPFDENNSQFEKLINSPRPVVADNQRNKIKPAASANSDWAENDLDVFQQCMSLFQEKAYFSEQIEENIEYVSLQSNYEEYNQVFLFLQQKVMSLNKEINELQQEKDRILAWNNVATTSSNKDTRRKAGGGAAGGRRSDRDNETTATVGNQEEEDEINEKRNLISFLQSLQLSTEKEQQTSAIVHQMKENDLALMYLQMRQKERDEHRRGSHHNSQSNLSAISSIPNLSYQKSANSPLVLSADASKTSLQNNHRNKE